MALFKNRKNINFLAVAMVVITIGIFGIAIGVAQAVATRPGYGQTVDAFQYFSTGVVVMTLGYISLQVEMIRVGYKKK